MRPGWKGLPEINVVAHCHIALVLNIIETVGFLEKMPLHKNKLVFVLTKISLSLRYSVFEGL